MLTKVSALFCHTAGVSPDSTLLSAAGFKYLACHDRYAIIIKAVTAAAGSQP